MQTFFAVLQKQRVQVLQSIVETQEQYIKELEVRVVNSSLGWQASWHMQLTQTRNTHDQASNEYLTSDLGSQSGTGGEQATQIIADQKAVSHAGCKAS